MFVARYSSMEEDMMLENAHHSTRSEAGGRVCGRDFFRGRFAETLWIDVICCG